MGKEEFALRDRIKAFLLAVGLMLSLCACEEEPAAETPAAPPSPVLTAEPQKMAFTLPWTGEELDPIRGRSKVDLSLSGLIWEGLFALDRTFTPQAVLCGESRVSEDGLTWTFALKRGVTFSDGSPLTAQDAADSLLRAREAGTRFSSRLAEIQEVTVQEGELVIRLTRPNGALPALLDIPIVRETEEGLVGTGPYVLMGEGEEARLEVRETWWRRQAAEPSVWTIPLRILREADDLIYSFDTGDISLVAADLTGASALGFAGNGYEVWDYPTTTMVFVGYNCAAGPCADPALRRALSRGYDRTTVAVSLYARHAAAAALPVHPDTDLYQAEVAQPLEYAPQALADGLVQAGYEKGEDGYYARGRQGLSLTMLVNTDNSFRLAVAEYLAGELDRAGIRVELQKKGWTEYQQALAAGNFDLYVGAVAMTADFDPAPLIEPGGALNYGRFAGGETAELLARFQAAAGEERIEAAGALYAMLAQEAPFTPLCFKHQSVLTQWGRVEGLTPTQQDPFYGIPGWDVIP